MEQNNNKKRGRKPKNNQNKDIKEFKQLNDMEVLNRNEEGLNRTNDSLNEVSINENGNNQSVIPSQVNTDSMDIENIEVNGSKSIKSIKGLGDAVKVVTNTLGIKTCDKCEERRKKLNRMFPFTKVVKVELSDKDIEFVNSIDKKITSEERIKLGDIHDKVFGSKTRHCSCPGLYKSMLERLKIQIDYQNIK